ncbi:MAG TPA: aminotransferase class I/II-fold pyridoxal phosphate-dependent enzyme [Pseudomonadales bacterium]|nr:aminotransferase class I/II-fold pyridoxal phosphate-dependent enzyme [Pseudomonadales bacterium]
MRIEQASREQLEAWRNELRAQYADYQQRKLALDLTRGKPSAEQLALSDALDGNLHGNYTLDNTDLRNYGGLEGLPSARKLGAELLGLNPTEVIAGGSSSLTMMYQSMLYAWMLGPDGKSAWRHESDIKFLCPSPGYDRHFAICEQLGIDMITVRLTDSGPDMDQVEALVKADPSIKGMWCVPKYGNPTGCVYSAETVDRIAALGKIAAGNFRVFWDNAYVVHDLDANPPALANIMDRCRAHGTENSVLQFTSTSKITHAGAGVAFMGASEANLAVFCKQLGICTIGPDKINQARHVRLLPDAAAVKRHMAGHAAILKPRFDCVLEHLDRAFTNSDLGEWTKPVGGYFVSFNTRPGLASTVVRLAAEAGVKLTPAGATFPYGKDPENRNIRLAPSFPKLPEVDLCMAIFTTCVKLASVEQALAG